jgi:uroporphyrinogen-III synthase
VLRELSLKPDIAAERPTTDGIIEMLKDQPLRGRRIAVQLYGIEPNVALESFLRSAGAQVTTVAPYVYAGAAEDAAVLELLNKMAAGAIDVIAFTSSLQVERLFAVADAALVNAALTKTEVAAVGPVVAATLAKHDIAVKLMPEDSYFMKPLTSAIEQGLGGK